MTYPGHDGDDVKKVKHDGIDESGYIVKEKNTILLMPSNK